MRNEVNTSLQNQTVKEIFFMAFLTVLLGLSGLYLPFLKIFIDLCWTIPIIVVIMRQGFRAGVVTTGLTGLLFFILLGPGQTLILLLQFGVLALFYGFAFKKGVKPKFTLSMGIGIAVAAIFAVMTLLALVWGIDKAYFVQQMQNGTDAMMEGYRDLGLFDGVKPFFTEEVARQQLEYTIAISGRLLPAFYVLWGMLVAFINYHVAQLVLSRIKISVPALPSLWQWRLPWGIAWGFIVGYGAYLAGDYLTIQKLTTVGLNIMLVYAPILLILGIAVYAFYLKKYFVRSGSRLIVTFLFLYFLQFTFFFVLVGVGLLDLFFNYRKLVD